MLVIGTWNITAQATCLCWCYLSLFCYYYLVFAKMCFKDLCNFSFLWFRCLTTICKLHSLCANRNWLYLKISYCTLKLVSYDKMQSNRKVIKFGGTYYIQLQDIQNLICWRWSCKAPQKHQCISTRPHDIPSWKTVIFIFMAVRT